METRKTTKPYPAELRDRAVRLVREHEAEHGSQWAAICSISEKVGCRSNPFIASLGRAGLVGPDPMGLGLSVDAEAQAIGARASVGGPILVCGPLARGEVGELMGVPEVSGHAELVARKLSLWLEQSSREIAKVS